MCAHHSAQPRVALTYFLSVSAQIIMRGHRSAGYGFVALSNAEAVQKAVDQLNKTELDGRQVIIEIAKPSDQKNQEMKERRTKRRPGRRGSKAVPGEVTEAEANGDAPKADDASEPAAAGPRKIKRRKKKVSVRISHLSLHIIAHICVAQG